MKLAYGINEVPEVAPIGKTRLYEEIKNGNLKARKLRGRTMILASDLAAYLEALPTTHEVALTEECSSEGAGQ
jgi:hypothetical protein